MRVSKKYRLELHWDRVDYNRNDLASLTGAYFTGPVLEDAEEVKENDELTLDMTSQHLVFIDDYYHAFLRWKGVEYRDGKIFLGDATIKGKHINSIEVLRDNDWILIDCSEHEEKKHPFHLVYWAEVCKVSGEVKY